jgi:hypothetical protein
MLRGLVCFAALVLNSVAVLASEYRGVVDFGGVPVPGVTVKASQAGKTVTATTGDDGSYLLPDLADGNWTIEVDMTGFAPLKQDVVIAPTMPPAQWDLKLLPVGEIQAAAAPPPGQSTPVPEAPAPAPKPQEKAAGNTPPPPPPSDEMNEKASNGVLVNGSMNNGAASPFAQSQAFGNNRFRHGLYNGNVGFSLDNSALDARPYSSAGLNTPKTAYNDFTGKASLGGPLRIPHVMPNGPNFTVNYQWTRNRNAITQSGTMPTAAERSGNFSQAVDGTGKPIQIFNPATGQPFLNNTLPSIGPQAQALLQLFPLPNVDSATGYNYQIPIVSPVHIDQMQVHAYREISPRLGSLNGQFAFQDSRSSTPNAFNFVDTNDTLGLNGQIQWIYRLTPRIYMTTTYFFSRYRARSVPFFADRENISANAGITGNLQDPSDWGPPALSFSNFNPVLSDGNSAFNRNQSSKASYLLYWNHERHNVQAGGDFNRRDLNVLSQANPRGGFGFNGAATAETLNGTTAGGYDFADFLLGIPDSSQIAYGNADKYFRESIYDAFITDDWRVSPGFTANIGMRWEYGAPVTELKGRLVNLDVASGFAAVAPVLGSNPVGSLTATKYPSSLIRPYKAGFEPRVAIAWRPLPASSLVIHAGYDIGYDSSIYQTLANNMSQQAPLSKSLNVSNSAACPLTLTNGFLPCSATTETTFAIDPNLHVGYAQVWNLNVQRDLPGSMQVIAEYVGTKGTHAMQEFLPNTYPIGAANPCPGCPLGFQYVTSGGNSTRQSGDAQLRRRLHNGLTWTVQYTFSKSVDDAASLGGLGASSAQSASSSGAPAAALSLGNAQNWLNLKGERSLSNFDQRHLLNVSFTYTTGMGVKGGTLLSGWKGALYKEWTFFTLVTAGSGLPLTPTYPYNVSGTGYQTERPDVTGAPIHAAPKGLFLNPAAFAAPASGQWGDAGRNSITGPSQFSLNTSVGRTFRLKGNESLDFRVDSLNTLNHVTFSSWNTTVGTTQFGLPPTSVGGMRSLLTNMTLRF